MGPSIGFGVDIWENGLGMYDRFARYVLAVEKLGFDSIWAADAHRFDLLVKLTVAAVKTMRVKVGTVVLVPAIRNPVILARTLSSLDLVSDGRLILGVGAGGSPEGFESMGIPPSKPATRMLETIQIIKRLWTEPSVTFSGEFYHLKDCGSPLKPVQVPHPPIWIGANGPRMLEITARIGDGWFGDVLAHKYEETLSKIRRMAKESGRNPDEIIPARLEFTSIAKDHETARTYLPPVRWPGGWKPMTKEEESEWIAAAEKHRIFGTPDEYIEGIERLVKSGARHFILAFYAPNEKAYLDSLKLCAEEVVPYFREQ